MKLLLLRCPQCQSLLEPEQLDVVVGCQQCLAAVAVEETGLRLVNVNYAASKFEERHDAEVIEQWVPFWVFNGRIHLSQRDTQGGSKSAQREAEQFWDVPRRLYVPAWDLPLATAREMGQKFTQEQTPLQAIPQPSRVHLVSAVVTPEDALKLLEFIVLSIEAQRKDWLKNLKFRIEADSPDLWALPARVKGSRWLFDLAGN